jgi:radical SAM superfamily enzyme YgiQ (UPF0313 family)
MIGFLRRSYPDLKIICGGGLITSWMHRSGWNNPFQGFIDHCIDGPGENAVCKLMGVPAPQTSSIPDYSQLPLNEYLAPGRILPYSTSSGCLWNRCTFCPEPAETNQFMAIPPRKAIQEVHQLTQTFRPLLIHFLDNALSPAFLKEIIANPPGPLWYGFTRIHPLLTDLDYCSALRASGCIMLKLGIESGDQTVLDALDKGITTHIASQALQTLKKSGIATYVYLLFGTPAETRQQAQQTLYFVEQHAAAITFLNLAIFNMPIGAQDVKKYHTSHFYYGDLSLYTDFEHPAGWNRKVVRKFLEHEFKRSPAVSAIIQNDPPFFTSNHAPFFVQ